MAAKAIMIQGTASNAGKSLLAAGLCRVFRQDGYRVAPFKSQNMALNSFITADGLEMGRAQVVQAQCAGVEPDARMNPVLLKPTNDTGSQVIVNGVPRGTMGAVEYFRWKKNLLPDILAAYESLAAENDIIVIEGAGSPAEINLKQDDFVNMGMARLAGAPVLLAGDIDRGGVFASLYGTVKLLEPEEQARIKGLIINKFRGDVEILRPGLKTLEELTGKPVLGVVPMLDVDIDEEDSLSSKLSREGKVGLADIAVIRLPRLSNFTDFSPLERVEEATVRYVRAPGELGEPDLVILPGTKSTMDDLKWLRQSGLEAKILQYASRGGAVAGICGGYQMLGRTLSDPEGVESGGTLRGMGLLPIDTVFLGEKTRTRVSGTFQGAQGVFTSLNGAELEGYEIHMGETTRGEGAEPLTALTTLDGQTKADGTARGNVWGSYVHGIFDRAGSARALVDALLARKGLAPSAGAVDWRTYQEEQYDKLAAGVRESLDLSRVYRILRGEE
ncbi:MAG TPA: cobyric acid synthase [Candidatus Intestinimonas pullistercoris]|uniref:Cobyric acid synthase n=1 Tax=Candidatus Intestinimonas pullistercoris TaxID=2838623 RepID=A0A9D2NZN0_9FIRM|nr:cobyric acid synthase [uncultured Intestinimonas sp.]HJC41365.1 cobyric acid synthase [Candidatus Intestinimonas pullistercoris]